MPELPEARLGSEAASKGSMELREKLENDGEVESEGEKVMLGTCTEPRLEQGSLLTSNEEITAGFCLV
jgi:hypothetical protein